MSKTRRPPDILRKSHPHMEAEDRARRKRELFDALDEAIDDDDLESDADSGSGNESPTEAPGQDDERMRPD